MDQPVAEDAVVPSDFTQLNGLSDQIAETSPAVNLSAGMAVYLDANSNWTKAQANAQATCSGTVGIMCCRSYSGQPAFVATNGILPMGLWFTGAVTVNAGGGSYMVGDILTLVGGTFTRAATLQVLTLSGSAVATVKVVDPGIYTVPPSLTGAVSVTGGHGSSATFNLTTAAGTTFGVAADNPGAICPIADLTAGGPGSGNCINALGCADASGNLVMNVVNYGVQL